MNKKIKTKKRDYVAVLTIYGLHDDVRDRTVANWLLKTSEELRWAGKGYDNKIVKFRLMK